MSANYANIFPIITDKNVRYGNLDGKVEYDNEGNIIFKPREEEEEVDEKFDWLESTKKHLEATTDWKSNATKTAEQNEKIRAEKAKRNKRILAVILGVVILGTILYFMYKN